MHQGMATWLVVVLIASLIAGGVAAWYLLRPSGAPAPAAAPLPDAVGDYRAAGAETVYDRESIFKYIDGHAEVYLAYGFQRCRSRRYAGPSGEPGLTLDVFEMASATDAFGVFTLDRDGDPVGIGRDSLFRYGWLSLWKGRHFVSIMAERETEAAKRATLDLGRALAALLPDEGELPRILEALPAAGLQARSVRYLHDPAILNTHRFVDSENIFGLGPATPAALGRYDREGGRTDLLVVEYPDEASAGAALAAFERRFPVADDAATTEKAKRPEVMAARQGGHRLAAVLGAPSRAVAEALLSEALEAEAPNNGQGGPQ